MYLRQILQQTKPRPGLFCAAEKRLQRVGHSETRENSRGIRGVLRVDRRRFWKDNVLACHGRKRKSTRSGDTHRSLQSLPGNRWKDHRLEPNQGSFCSGSQSIATLQLLAEETEKQLQETQNLSLKSVPGSAETTFRNNPWKILFLLSLGKDVEPTTDLETPVWGYFLQREVEALCGV